MSEIILFEKLNKEIGILKFNRPDALNAINSDMLRALSLRLSDLEKDHLLRVIILTGVGKAFIAGADIKEMKHYDKEEAIKFSELGNHVLLKLEVHNKIMIAAVNGFALGGGLEVAMSCDLRFLSDKAKVGQPEVNIGVIPGFGGTQRLSRLVGISKAKDLIFSGEQIDAETSLRIHLADRIFPHDELLDKTIEYARNIVKAGPTSLIKAKQIVYQGYNMKLQDAVKLESEAFGDCFKTGEANEGMSAFLEKRNPRWIRKD